MRLYLARHGEAKANVTHVIENRGLGSPLTRTGRRQAADLAAFLEGRPIARIYSSPLLRAIQTSVIVATRLDVEFEVVEALREFDCGVAEGRSDEEAWSLWRGVFDAWRQPSEPSEPSKRDLRIPGGESFHDVRNRFAPFIESLIRQFGGTDAELLCVAHGGLFALMLPEVLANLDEAVIDRHEFDHGRCLVAELGASGLACTEWNGLPVDEL